MNKDFKIGLIAVAIYLGIDAIGLLVRMFIYSIDNKGVPAMLINWFLALVNLPGVIITIPGWYSANHFGFLVVAMIASPLVYFMLGFLISKLLKYINKY